MIETLQPSQSYVSTVSFVSQSYRSHLGHFVAVIIGTPISVISVSFLNVTEKEVVLICNKMTKRVI